jgi:DNA-binding transcriptional LysR family regulator
MEPKMERVRRLTRFWSWLPAFRVVAETEHLPSAAEALGTSPPGLSRMIKLLEHDLGQPLFRRAAGRLRLNPAGELFLGHVRDAMRLLDDGLQELGGRTAAGPIVVSASNSVSWVYLLPALDRLAQRYPDLVPDLVSWETETACRALLKGTLDLALVEEGEVPEPLAVERLVEITYGVYCGPGHPLSRRRPTLDDCLAHPFVGASGAVRDGWPPNLRRRVGLRVSALHLAMEVCAGGRFLALLPDDAAAHLGKRLRRLPVGTLARGTVWVAYRRPLRRGGPVESLRQELARVAGGRSRG